MNSIESTEIEHLRLKLHSVDQDRQDIMHLLSQVTNKLTRLTLATQDLMESVCPSDKENAIVDLEKLRTINNILKNL